MIEERIYPNQTNVKVLNITYLITLLFLALSGFGQMPIFKRYYIADIPGLGWLAKFYVTHLIHYMGAILILALFAYMVVQYGLVYRTRQQPTTSGYVRGGLLAGIVITGVLLVIRNLESVWMPSGLIIFLDITHLGLVMGFLFTALYCLIFRKPWTKSR